MNDLDPTEHPMSHTLASPPSDSQSADATDTDLLDAEWLAAPAKRSRTRLLLVAALAVLVVFLGGVLVEKRWGADSSSAAGAAGFPGGAGGFSPPSGANPFSGGEAAGGSGTTDPGSTTGGSTSTDSDTTDTPALIGTVSAVHGDTWTVKDLGGTAHTVEVTGKTTLTRPLADAGKSIGSGTQVSVQGTTHGRTVTATAITLR